MSKYNPLWKYIAENDVRKISFCEVEKVLGFPIDHSFLSFKKELTEYGYEVKKISMKNQTILFESV